MKAKGPTSKMNPLRAKVIRDKNGRVRSVSISLPSLRFLPWDDIRITKMQARHLIKWFLGHKHDANRLPFLREKRNKIRTKKALRNAIVHGIKDNLSAVKLLDEYRLLDVRSAKRQRKVFIRSKWKDKEIAEVFMEVHCAPAGHLTTDQKRSVGRIRSLLKKIEKLEDKLERRYKRKR